MSFNPKGSRNTSSSRESEVLQRQRLMASRLAAAKKTNASDFKRADKDEHDKKQSRQKIKKASSVTIKGAGTTTSPILIGGEITADMALEHARRRAAAKSNSQQQPLKDCDSEKKPAAKPPSNSSKFKRPTVRRTASSLAATSNRTNKVASIDSSKPSSVASGSLSSLLLSNTETAKYLKPDAPKLLKHYDKIEPDDYWKNVRNWDFLRELNDKMIGNNSASRKRKRDNSDGNTNSNKLQPLPDTFESYRQYCALWAPLCLEEARAQLLSEAITEIPYWRSKPDKSPIKVLLQPLKKDLNGSSESMGVQVKSVLGNDYTDRPFIANDIVLLVKRESYIWDASKGNLFKADTTQKQPVQKNDNGGFGLVGHCEYSRRSTEGITIKVSRELWTQVGSKEMILIKIGSNITALREFTALCRLDTIPLLDYILGSKMSHYSPVRSKKKRNMNGEVSNVGDSDDDDGGKAAKNKILSKMGGSSALGKGFAEYASQKYNISQLSAIAASAQEYGDGGFTLIKG